LFRINVDTGVDFYNNWSFPFVIVFLLSLIGTNLPSDFGLKKFSFLITGLIISGILFALIGSPTSNALANIGFPFLSAGLLITAYSIIKISEVKTKKISSLGKRIVHFGLIITLIGVLISAGSRQSSFFVEVPPNSTLDSLGINVKLANFTVFSGSGRVYAEKLDAITPEHTSLRLDVEVLQDGKNYKGSLWSFLYINYGFVSNPLVITTEKGDIYLHLNMTESMYISLSQSFTGKLSIPENLTITVEKVPLIYLVWIGVALLCIGGALNALGDFAIPTLTGKKMNKNLLSE
jgi:cytochrome c biogenesis factor